MLPIWCSCRQRRLKGPSSYHCGRSRPSLLHNWETPRSGSSRHRTQYRLSRIARPNRNSLTPGHRLPVHVCGSGSFVSVAYSIFTVPRLPLKLQVMYLPMPIGRSMAGSGQASPGFVLTPGVPKLSLDLESGVRDVARFRVNDPKLSFLQIRTFALFVMMSWTTQVHTVRSTRSRRI